MKTEINRPTASKINATAAIVALVNLAAAFGYIPENMQTEIVALVNTLGPVAIITFRTWFTKP